MGRGTKNFQSLLGTNPDEGGGGEILVQKRGQVSDGDGGLVDFCPMGVGGELPVPKGGKKKENPAIKAELFIPCTNNKSQYELLIQTQSLCMLHCYIQSQIPMTSYVSLI